MSAEIEAAMTSADVRHGRIHQVGKLGAPDDETGKVPVLAYFTTDPDPASRYKSVRVRYGTLWFPFDDLHELPSVPDNSWKTWPRFAYVVTPGPDVWVVAAGDASISALTTRLRDAEPPSAGTEL